MIGVLANSGDDKLVREFFELFKTPWEFYRQEEQYEVVLFAREDANVCGVTASLTVVYSSQETPFDKAEKIQVASRQKSGTLSYRGSRIPIYGNNVTFQDKGISLLRDEQSQCSAGLQDKSSGKSLVRIGYDLFRELGILLTDGQPPENAGIPTLELHIALLRDLIVESGIPLVEIPPIPEGHTFIACLTHDVDHPSIRHHKWDHTAFGFLYRAVIGSVLAVLRGRAPVRHLLTNWAAAAKLPFIYLGLAQDFWYQFDRYLDMEGDVASTFFVLPFKDRPGKTASGLAPRIRASGYGAGDITERLQAFVSAGREIGLHGIDAWIDSATGQEEKAQIVSVTGAKNVGVRMHWLYFNESSPVALDRAGFTYDSTVGYNETIGYRAGTTQVYKPLQANHLLELPLHIMDTALFYPDYLDLTGDEAEKQVNSIINTTCKFGGAVTINWHDRSIAPERLWGDFYARLIDQLKTKGAWCAGAGGAVAWFQARRSVSFQRNVQGIDVTVSDAHYNSGRRVPGLKVRVYHSMAVPTRSSQAYSESALTTTMSIPLPGGSSISCHE